MSRVGGRTYVWTCGMCGHRAEGYAPKNYRTVTIGTRRSDGTQLLNEDAVVCGDLCEAHWLMQAASAHVNELMGYE